MMVAKSPPKNQNNGMEISLEGTMKKIFGPSLLEKAINNEE